MANVIKIKKGLDINLKGKAPEEPLTSGKSASFLPNTTLPTST